MRKIPLRVKRIPGYLGPLPSYATAGSACFDLYAYIPNQESLVLWPGERKLIQTGIMMEIPEGYEGQIRPRSGNALKKGFTILNSPGTIDSDYRLEIGVIVINHNNEKITINNGDRIAQMAIVPVPQVEILECSDLSDTERKGGFGSSGV